MIELASLIRDLRGELQQAVAAAEDATLRFELETVELEVSVALERTGQAAAKVRFWVLDGQTDAKRSDLTTQRISLALKPIVDGTEGPAYVAGRAAPDER